MNQALQFVASNFANIIQGATLIVVIIYTVYTARMTSAARASADAANNTVKEMKEARDQENAPYIVVYFDIPANKHVFYLVIKNVGKSIATNVRLIFTPPLSSSVFNTINDVPLIKDGIPSLPPDYELRTFFDGIVQYYGNPNFPRSYSVEISYSGGLIKERRTSTQILDLSMFYGLMKGNEKGLDELVKAIEDIAKHTRDINQNLEEMSEGLASGIWIKNPSLTTEINSSAQTWHDSILAKLQELVLSWTTAQRDSDDKQVNPFVGDIRNKLILISGQLVVLLSQSPEAISNEVKEAISSISASLLDLGYKRFYIDGGASIKAFNDLGDCTVQDINMLTKQLSQEKRKIVDGIVEEVFD